MFKKTNKSVVAAAVGAVLLASTGAIAIAHSSDGTGYKKTHYSGGEGMRKHGMRHGGHGGRMMMRLLRQADVNKDGALTQEELDTYRAQQVTDADANGDGTISVEEFQTIWLAQTKQRMVRAFQRLDSDASGSITKEEQDAPFANLIERLDRNDDGKLDREDRKHHREGRGQQGENKG